MSELRHYAPNPVTLDRAREYVQREPHTFTKPVGFWVSVPGEDDWPTWCTKESNWPERIQYAHDVILSADANILWITSPHELDQFQSMYAVETNVTRMHHSISFAWPIDWQRVAADFDGIIIAPYQWSRRMDADWYYGWDCASGCIWNLDAIASVAPHRLTVSESVAS